MSKLAYYSAVLILLAFAAPAQAGGAGHKDAKCITKCGLDYINQQSACPSPVTDEMANLTCVQKANDANQACVNKCPMEGAATSSSTSTGTSTKVKPQP